MSFADFIGRLAKGPRDWTPPLAVLARALAGKLESMTRPTILIVDADTELTKIIGAFLNAQGFRVNAAMHPREAIKKLSLQKYAAIVLDPDLGGERGEEVILASADPMGLNSRTPVYLATRSLKYEIPTSCVAKLEGILVKPFRFEELLGFLKPLTQSASAA